MVSALEPIESKKFHHLQFVTGLVYYLHRMDNIPSNLPSHDRPNNTNALGT